MTGSHMFGTVSLWLHALADRRQSPDQERASDAVDRLNATSERVIAKGGDPLRDEFNSMAEHR